MDFREVSAFLYRSNVEFKDVSFGRRSVEMKASAPDGCSSHTISFRDVTILKWQSARQASGSGELVTVGLEKLGAGEVWRLYAQTAGHAELELSCRAIYCDGAEVTGIGRSYRH